MLLMPIGRSDSSNIHHLLGCFGHQSDTSPHDARDPRNGSFHLDDWKAGATASRQLVVNEQMFDFSMPCHPERRDPVTMAKGPYHQLAPRLRAIEKRFHFVPRRC